MIRSLKKECIKVIALNLGSYPSLSVPTELKEAILKYLKKRSLLHLVRLDLFADTALSRLDLQGSGTISVGSLMNILSCCQNLQHVGLSGFYDIGFDIIHQFKVNSHLVSLDLSNCSNLTDSMVDEVASCCPILQVLDISKTKVSKLMKGFSGLKKLKAVNCCDIQDSTMELFSSCAQSELQYINISGCNNLTNETLFNILIYNPSLTVLNINRIYNMNPRDLFPIVSSFKLCKLSISEMVEIDEVFTNPAQCIFLTHLDISSCWSIKDETFSSIARHCQNLKKLNVSHCIFINESFFYLGAVSNQLEYLNVSSCVQLDSLPLEFVIENNTNMNYLNISSCAKLNNKILLCVAKYLKNLKRLLLSKCNGMTTTGISEVLMNCRSLKSLIGRNCQFGEYVSKSLKYLAFSRTQLQSKIQCPNLQYLDLQNVKFPVEYWKYIYHCALSTLNIIQSPLQPNTLQIIANNPHYSMIQNLKLVRCEFQIDCESLSLLLSNLNILKLLDISWNTFPDKLQITSNTLLALNITGGNSESILLSCTNLEGLEIGRSNNLKDLQLETPNLVALSAPFCYNLNAEVIHRLPPKIQFLDLSATPIPLNLVLALAIPDLTLSQVGPSPDSLSTTLQVKLPPNPKLKHLSFNSSAISWISSDVPTCVESLDIGNCGYLNPEALYALLSIFPHLKHIEVGGTAVEMEVVELLTKIHPTIKFTFKRNKQENPLLVI